MKTFALGLTFALFSLSAFTAPVVLTTHNLSPYGSYPSDAEIRKVADDQFTGVAIDRLRCTFERMGQELQVLVVPWRRAQHMAEANEVDGFFAGSQNAYRDSYAVMSDVLASQNWQWYWVPSNDRPANTKVNRDNLGRIGAFQGSNMAKWLESNLYPINSRPKTTEQLMLQLKMGRIDTILANNLAMDQLSRQYGWQEVFATEITKEKPLGVYFTKHFLKQNPEFMAKFNTELAVCKRKE